MTDVHHAEARHEATRLRRSPGSALITDSFGETRFMGALANTRCLGDLRYKPYGVTAEPEVRTKLLERGEWAFVILASDGVTSLVSDAEMCGIARNAYTPKDAASAILSYAEEMGSEDNGTVIVLPLAGWGQVRGPDTTTELRKYRRTQMSRHRFLFIADHLLSIMIQLARSGKGGCSDRSPIYGCLTHSCRKPCH
jgi:protein phosphatase PTC6